MPKPLLPGQWLRVVGLTVTLLLALLPARAQSPGTEFTSGDLVYRVLTENTVEVAGPAEGTTPIDITIPITVENDGQNYDVTAIGRYAFLNNATLESVSLPNGIIRIEPVAFCACRKLSEINIPATVTYIGGEAFGGCENLASIVLPDNLEEIDEIAFHNTPIVTVTIPASLKQLGSHAFQNVSSIVFLGSTPPEITGWNTSLYFSKKDVNIYVPQEYKDAYAEWLPDYADRISEIKPMTNGAKSVKLVSIPKVVYSGQEFDVKVEVETDSGEPYEGSFVWSVSSYWNITPDGAEAHVKASYPADGVVSVTVISSEGLPIDATAEVYCVSLEAPDYVTLYPGKAYKAEASVKNADKIGDYEIRFVRDQYSDVFDVTEDGMITAKQPGSGWCEIQLYIDGTKVCGTGTNVYVGTGLEPQYNPMPVIVGQGYRGSAVVTGSNGSVVLTQLKSISNPDVVHIDDEANLFFIMAPVEVTLTYDYTFDTGETYEVSFVVKAYENISSIKIHETDNKNEAYVGETLQLYATINDTSDKATTINWSTSNYNVATIDRYGVVTARNPGLCKITARLLNSDVSTEYDIIVKALPEFVLDGIMYRVLTENTVEVAGPAEGVTPTDVVIPASVPYDGMDFNVVKVGSRAFFNCESLTSITLPEGLTLISDNAFEDCHNLASVSLPSTLTEIGRYGFGWCYALTSIDLPTSVTTLGYGAFFNCYNLTSVTLHEGLTMIGNEAFAACYSLPSIMFPESLESIGYRALQDSSALKSVYFLSATPPAITDGDDLSGLNNDVKIYVPAESVDVYKSWTEAYKDNIVGIERPANGATEVTLNLTSVIEPQGGNYTYQLQATVQTKDDKPYDGKYEWTVANTYNGATFTVDSADPSKATLSDWNAYNQNSVTVTVFDSQGLPIEATCTFTPLEVNFEGGVVLLEASDVFTLHAKITPENYAEENGLTLRFRSNNPDVATVDESTGEIVAVADGYSYIRVEILDKDGKILTTSGKSVYVCNEILPMDESLTLQAGYGMWPRVMVGTTGMVIQLHQLTVTEAASSDPGVLGTSSNGYMRANSAGSATVTYRLLNSLGKEYECVYYVKVVDKIDGIEIYAENGATTITPGSELQLHARTLDGDPVAVTWRVETLEGDWVAGINNNTGTVYAYNTGKIRVIANLTNNYDISASYDITISEIVVDGITIDKSTVILNAGNITQLNATVEPADAEVEIEWTSSNEDVASVDPLTGEVTAKNTGVATITATVKGTNISASCTVIVSNPTGIDDVDSDGVSVKGINGQIIVTGAPADAAVEIYSIAGSRIAIERGNCAVSVNTAIYVVRVAGTTVKVAVK